MLFVAEIGSNHKGILSLAHELIRQSALAGADIAKFQLGHDMNDPIRSLPMRHASELKEWCDHYGIEFMASIFNNVGFDVAESIGQERYKFPTRKAFESHSTADYKSLLKKVVATGKTVYVSGQTNGAIENVRGLACVARYPTYPKEIEMPDEFGDIPPLYYGYSTHVHGYSDALIAVARGAKLVEKHVTLDKTEESIKDNAFALSFDEFAQMVSIGREMERLL